MSERQSRTMARRPPSPQSASSASTSPERIPGEDDADSIMLQPNDSVSSLAISEPNEELDSAAREMEERYRLSPIHRLPAELMIAIFARLQKSNDLRNCMLVSRSWARNCVGLLWHRPSTSPWPSLQRVVTTLRSTQTTFDYHYLVKRLNLSAVGVNASDGVLLPFQHCKRIERLTLTGCTKLSDLSVSRVVDGNTSLMALDVTNISHLTDTTLNAVARSCYRLQGLNITNCKDITNEALESVASSCRHLKRVRTNFHLNFGKTSNLT
jgi:F-box and leucine-rich repeat protein GRR1